MNHKQPLGIYLHIPFCVQKCLYCDFLSFPVGKTTEQSAEQKKCQNYMEALLMEIEHASKMIDITSYEIQTIFIGGGTPSLINEDYITKTLCKLNELFSVSDHPEITIEANPGTLTESKLHSYRNAGINRLSIGLQSTQNEELRRLGRIHTYEEFLESYQMAREAGFENINVDLMTALPGQTMEDLKENLERVIALHPEHISAYSLIIEEGTPYAKLYQEEDLPPEETDREMYAMTGSMLAAAGYHRYEISNYALDGYESRHNTSYWKRIPYLGLGLGASSLMNETRWKNEDRLEAYIEEIQQGNLPRHFEVEKLTTQAQMEEFMFLGLRMLEGVSSVEFERTFGKSLQEVYGRELNAMISEGLLICYDHHQDLFYCLTLRGLDLSNYVFEQFL